MLRTVSTTARLIGKLRNPQLQPDGLPALAGLVFGGHDVSSHSLPKRAEELAAGGVVPPALVDVARAHLEAVDAEVRPGHVVGSATAAEAVERLAEIGRASCRERV